MKKIWTTALVLGLVLTSMTGIAAAQQYPMKKQNLYYDQMQDSLFGLKAKGAAANGQLWQNKDKEKPLERCPPDNKLKVRFKGKWGLLESNETEGYVGGILTRYKHGRFLKGVWNTTDNSTKGFVAGIFKRGYFNGKVRTGDDNATHITGLYKIDKEKQLLKMKWMTPHNAGWAVCRIVVAD